jgi:hypothetical protein
MTLAWASVRECHPSVAPVSFRPGEAVPVRGTLPT